MSREPIETVIIRAQQDFDVVGRLNPIQIEIKDDTVINILKKYKNVVYKVTPLGLLFPASIENDTRQIFVLVKEIKYGVSKINNKKVQQAVESDIAQMVVDEAVNGSRKIYDNLFD